MEIEWLFHITALCLVLSEEVHFLLFLDWSGSLINFEVKQVLSDSWLSSNISSLSLFILFVAYVVYCDSVSFLSFGYCLSGNRCKRIFCCFLFFIYFILFYFIFWVGNMRFRHEIVMHWAYNHIICKKLH